MAEKNLLQRIAAFFSSKGYDTKEKRSAIKAEDYKILAKDFETEFGDTIENVLKKANDETKLSNEMTTVMEAANKVLQDGKEEPRKTEKAEGGDDKKEDTTASDQKKETTLTSEQEGVMELASSVISKLTEKVKIQKQTIETLEQQEDKPKPKNVSAKIVPITGGVTTDKYLYGIQAPMFDMSKPWNQVAATRQPSAGRFDEDYEEGFKTEFGKYGKSLAKRIAKLQSTGELNGLKMEALDFTGFDGTGWGEQYIVRRQDALIAYLRTLPSVTSIFPVRYNVQDKMEMTNSFLTDFSQAYQSGEVFKGKHSVEPMLAEVFDVMFKHQFTDMKTLEKEYIGYLNREGSDPMKWSMIEWLMSQTLRKLLNEQNERRIKGAAIPAITGKAGHHLFGSDGLIRKMLFKYVADGLLTPFSTINTYVQATVLDVIETMVETVNQLIPEGLEGYRLYMNEKHIPWYLKAYETNYGTKLDYTGAELTVKHYSIGGIVGVPNMGNSCFLMITMPENVEFYEDLPGEMAGVYFERRLENLIAASWWKEGVGAYMVGKKNGTQADQFIFINDPFSTVAADATTIDVSGNNYFKTSANTGETVLTDLTNKKEGVVYRIVCGATANATKTAKANLFAGVDAWVPTAVGDYLEVYWDSTLDSGNGQFVEVDRKVTA